ncbi:DUF2572 family protein [Clostridium tagluense]|uniref:DUF2572 family protein n=1 Tax=Clostridium tagluense TaxID=360422 RepID=UPI001C0E1D1C|nr:DUF2572 family protein [Clostridium tagluense]MBU3127722.1 DUF2572 family protein [Clostridium tagluense]
MKSYRKKGSALVLILIVFSVLSILGMALISLAASNYKYRVVKGEVKKILYASEAGIDESYKIISSVVEKAINYGNEKVDIFTKTEMDKEIKKEKKREDEKKKVLNGDESFIDEEFDKSNPGSEYIKVKDDGDFDTDALVREQKAQFNISFNEYVIKNLIKENSNPYVLNGVYNYKLEDKNPKVVVKNGGSLKFIDLGINEKKEHTLNVELESTFINKNGMKKVISAQYEIITPEYKQIYSVDINRIKIPNMVWSKAIAVDGNMYVEEGNLNVGEESKLADIYVKGKDEEDIQKGEHIKNNGIIFQSQGSTVNILGNVMTNQDFLLSKKTTCTVNGSIYGKNVKVGKNDDTLRLEANGSILTVNNSGTVYTSDDLELNSNASKIHIKGNFYGIDDGSWINKEEDGLSNKSSAIIINSDDLGNLDENSQLSIGGQTIISGVGFIGGIKDPISNLLTEYKTGESIAIKGNYIAYTGAFDEKKLIGDGKKMAKVDFKYFDPLTLVWKFKDDATLGELRNQPLTSDYKSRYFKTYYEQYKGENQLKLNGITLGKRVNATGAVVSDGKIIPQNTPIEETELKTAKSEFNRMVNNMGILTKNEVYPRSPDNTFGKGEAINGIYNYKVNIDKLKDQDKPNGETLIYIKKDFNNYELDFNSNDYASVRKGIIIVNGDLTIKGNIDFTGSIIVSGDLKIIGSKDNTINIKYDKDNVRNLIKNYYNVFEGVFVNDNNDNDESVYDIKLNSNYGLDVNKDKLINNKDLIKLKNWKIN